MPSPTQSLRATGEHRAAGELLFELADATVGLVEETHRAIADRAFSLTLARHSPARRLHDLISGATYATIRGSGRLASALIAPAVDLTWPSKPGQARSGLSERRSGAVALGALNGWSGDRLERGANPLSVRMGWRQDGRLIEPDPDELARAHPDASGKLAVFLHGLMESEDVFWLGTRSRAGITRPNYGERLHKDLGYTPLYLRYNSGLHVSENGRRFAALLDRTVQNWPVPVTQIMIYGHSMGGLVTRSANHYAREGGLGYVELVRHVVHSGSPNHGSPLERFANGGGRLLQLLPESRGFARLVESRSSGVKDMRYGNIVDDDWLGHDPDELWRDHRTEVPLLGSATHYFLSASLTGDPGDRISRVLGDLLVLTPSAWAEHMHGNGRRFDVERSRNYGGITHFHMTSQPAIYRQLREWLTPRALPARSLG